MILKILSPHILKTSHLKFISISKALNSSILFCVMKKEHSLEMPEQSACTVGQIREAGWDITQTHRTKNL